MLQPNRFESERSASVWERSSARSSVHRFLDSNNRFLLDADNRFLDADNRFLVDQEPGTAIYQQQQNRFFDPDIRFLESERGSSLLDFERSSVRGGGLDFEQGWINRTTLQLSIKNLKRCENLRKGKFNRFGAVSFLD